MNDSPEPFFAYCFLCLLGFFMLAVPILVSISQLNGCKFLITFLKCINEQKCEVLQSGFLFFGFVFELHSSMHSLFSLEGEVIWSKQCSESRQPGGDNMRTGVGIIYYLVRRGKTRK